MDTCYNGLYSKICIYNFLFMTVKSKSQRTADIISMLVNIYGSKDVFITEYRTILADRILSQFSYDTEREIRYLEHLKVR